MDSNNTFSAGDYIVHENYGLEVLKICTGVATAFDSILVVSVPTGVVYHLPYYALPQYRKITSKLDKVLHGIDDE